MKKIQNYMKMTGFVIAAALMLSACGGGGEEWGIDQSTIPHCNSDLNDSSAAILVPPGTTVKSIEPGTTIRVWHYSNSDEMVCVITGSAVISGGN
jgi:ABC-type glycerol-3-phosphate transport system substrate-binding protein